MTKNLSLLQTWLGLFWKYIYNSSCITFLISDVSSSITVPCPEHLADPKGKSTTLSPVTASSLKPLPSWMCHHLKGWWHAAVAGSSWTISSSCGSTELELPTGELFPQGSSDLANTISHTTNIHHTTSIVTPPTSATEQRQWEEVAGNQYSLTLKPYCVKISSMFAWVTSHTVFHAERRNC